MRIILGRHAPSLGQKDLRFYYQYGDAHVPLDPEHAHLSIQCGQFLRDYFKQAQITQPPLFWTSQFLRAQQTYTGITQGLGDAFGEDLSWHQKRWHIDTLLNERSFGLVHYTEHFRNPLHKAFSWAVTNLSKVLYRQDPFSSRAFMGDSPRDVVKNTRLFLSSSFQHDVDDGEDNFVIISHGAVTKAIIMHWFHLYDLNSWHDIPTPENCDLYLIEGKDDNWSIRQIYDGPNAKSLLDKDINPIAHIKRPNQKPLPALPSTDFNL